MFEHITNVPLEILHLEFYSWSHILCEVQNTAPRTFQFLTAMLTTEKQEHLVTEYVH